MADLTRQLKTESTWQQGANAFRAGLPQYANPYRLDPGAWDEQAMNYVGWENGYCWARLRGQPAQGGGA